MAYSQQPYYQHAPPQQRPGQPPPPLQMPVAMAPVVQQMPVQVAIATPPPPPIAEDADRVEKMANYVARNGCASMTAAASAAAIAAAATATALAAALPTATLVTLSPAASLQFEQVLREKQAANPKFQFLSPAGEYYHYYRHVLNCLMNGGWTLEQVRTQRRHHFRHGDHHLPRRAHHTSPQVAQVRNQHYQQHPPAINPGALTSEEAATLHGLLGALNGSKDTITAGREWIIQHAAKATAVRMHPPWPAPVPAAVLHPPHISRRAQRPLQAMVVLRERAQAIQQEPPVSGPAGPDGVLPVPSTSGAFTRILFLIYVINDVLFRAVTAGDGGCLC